MHSYALIDVKYTKKAGLCPRVCGQQVRNQISPIKKSSEWLHTVDSHYTFLKIPNCTKRAAKVSEYLFLLSRQVLSI